jgi:hypothetical protein
MADTEYTRDRAAFEAAMEGEELDFTLYTVPGCENSYSSPRTQLAYFAWRQGRAAPPDVTVTEKTACKLCKGTGVADLPDPWGGVRGTCPDCHGTGTTGAPLAALPSASLGEPEGWKLVPVALTPEMVKADPYGMGYGRLHAIWARLLAASPASKSAGGGGERDERKPWERTDWACARARVDSEGMHCPDNKCPDCPKRSLGQLGTSPDQQEQ